MKKKVLRTMAALICVAAFTLPSCEFLEDCGTCELVTDDGFGNVTTTPPLIYCGDQYYDKVNSSPTYIGDAVSYWNCY